MSSPSLVRLSLLAGFWHLDELLSDDVVAEAVTHLRFCMAKLRHLLFGKLKKTAKQQQQEQEGILIEKPMNLSLLSLHMDQRWSTKWKHAKKD